MKKLWFSGRVLWLMVALLVISRPINAEELKEKVIRELAADLAELSRIVQPEMVQPEVVSRTLPEDWIVGGVVANLKPIWQKAAKDVGFHKDANIATVNKAFKPTSMVTIPVLVQGAGKLLKAEGVRESYLAFDFIPEAWLAWGGYPVAGYPGVRAGPPEARYRGWPELGVEAQERTIKRFLEKINQMIETIKGEGIVVRGFSIYIPVVLGSVNFELE